MRQIIHLEIKNSEVRECFGSLTTLFKYAKKMGIDLGMSLSTAQKIDLELENIENDKIIIRRHRLITKADLVIL